MLVVLLSAACMAESPPTASPTEPATGGPPATPADQPTDAPATPDDGRPTAPATPDATPEATPTTGGTVRIAMAGFPDYRNPGNGVLAEAYTLYELVYDTPITITADGQYVPELASEWSVSDDELTWTLTIVEGATFHDGEPLTAEDVAFTLNLYQATEDFPFLPSYTAGFTAVEAPDATTVQITTEEPIGNFESRMVFMYVLPQHIWEGQDAATFENAEMVGSGAFSLAEYDQGISMTLEAVKDHWSTPPIVDRVIFQTIGNPDARIAALQQGNVDMITEFPATAVNTLRNDPNVEVLIAEPITGSLTDIFFNLVDPADCPEDGVCSGHPALRDVEVRRALAEATDKQQIVDVSLLGLGEPGLSLVPTGLGDFFAAGVQDYAFSVDAANQRLETAGYVDSDGDGIRECLADQNCPTGDLTFRLFYPNDSDVAPREADLISDMWQAVGVSVQIQALDPDTLTSVCCPTFDFDVIRWGWGSDPDPAFLLGTVLCDEVDSGWSETGYCNEAYDALYAAANVETDHAARVDLVHQMQQILIDDVPYIIAYYYKETQAFRRDTFVGWPMEDPTLTLQSAESLTTIRPAP
ncbi:MAG TPA: ABC transporter substrate-binding protein [Candidatus Limnocylindria bacterium]|nr:ABC transporter substrate-binding protein [Candidatus Limnocylindria bacterium]